ELLIELGNLGDEKSERRGQPRVDDFHRREHFAELPFGSGISQLLDQSTRLLDGSKKSIHQNPLGFFPSLGCSSPAVGRSVSTFASGPARCKPDSIQAPGPASRPALR